MLIKTKYQLIFHIKIFLSSEFSIFTKINEFKLCRHLLIMNYNIVMIFITVKNQTF
jgi:hypothetical protein